MTNWNMRTEPLELKDGSTIKNYHYEFNSTDRVVAKIVEDVFKAIMDISADRKTEPQTEVDWKQRLCDMYGANRKSFDEAWEKYEADKVTDEPQTERSE